MADTSEQLAPVANHRNRVVCGDAEAVLRRLPAECAQLIVTSPPYYQQRDYKHPDQVGFEASAEDYVQRLIRIFREARRTLHRGGTLWLNLGDKYEGGRLLGLPWRTALGLQDDGWTLRSDIVWYKPNAMPSSVKNRPTTDHEYVFLFAKSEKYYYDSDAIREPHVTFSDKSRMRGGRNHFGRRGGTPEQGKNGGHANLHTARWDQAFHPKGRNKRTLWEIPLSKFPGAHFAVFPERLVENCVLAGSQPGDLVLDPFLGSGTTAVVAQKLGRCYTGIDCNAEYCEVARKRIRRSAPLKS
jgi:site-specific DNA-methyltransferase (adenine-specific)